MGEGNSITVQEQEEAFSQSVSHLGQLIPSPTRSGYISLPPWSTNEKPAVDTREGGPQLEGRGLAGREGRGREGEVQGMCDTGKSIL